MAAPRGAPRRPKGSGAGGGGSGGDGEEVTFKVLMLGDSTVGKTCIMARGTAGDKAKMETLTTVGMELGKRRAVVDGRQVKLNIWDTSGQEKYRAITRSFYRGSQAVVLVYDVTRKDTFLHVRYWLKEIADTGEDMAIMLLGNKVDKPAESREVSTAAGAALAAELGISFFETSAVTAAGIEEAFTSLTRELMRRHGIAPLAGGGGGAKPVVAVPSPAAGSGGSSTPAGLGSGPGTKPPTPAWSSKVEALDIAKLHADADSKPPPAAGGCAC